MMDILKEIDITSDTKLDWFDENVISKNRKLLHLRYLEMELLQIDFPENAGNRGWVTGKDRGNIVSGYNKFFDLLDEQTNLYDLLEVLYICDDNIFYMPETILKFKRLKCIIADGCRFWNLDMKHIPSCIKIIDYTRQSNLHASCIKGVERLLELEELHLDMAPFQIHSFMLEEWASQWSNAVLDNVIPFPDVNGSKLHTIVFTCPTWNYGQYPDEYVDGSDSLRSDWKENILQNPFFMSIKHRVISVHHSMENDYLPVYRHTNIQTNPVFEVQIKLKPHFKQKLYEEIRNSYIEKQLRPGGDLYVAAQDNFCNSQRDEKIYSKLEYS